MDPAVTDCDHRQGVYPDLDHHAGHACYPFFRQGSAYARAGRMASRDEVTPKKERNPIQQSMGKIAEFAENFKIYSARINRGWLRAWPGR